MKTQGSFHGPHAIPFNLLYTHDALKQLLQKIAREEARFRAKLNRAARNHKSAKAVSKEEEVAVDPEVAKFPPLGIGVSIWRTNIVEWEWGQIGPPPPLWHTFRQGENAVVEIEDLLAKIRDRHSGYVSTSGKIEFYPTPEKYESIGMVPYDDMIFTSTVTTPEWDSDALSESLRAGEVSKEEFERMILEPLYKFFSDGKMERLISCGAARGLVYLGVDVHSENGTLHFHARFLKSAPLGFRDEFGVIHPRSGAPDRGRRKQGAGWVGGETLGLRGNTGKVISNSLCVAFCATDAWRKDGMPPPCDYGNNWNKLEREISARKASHGLPFDLVASRFLRGLIRILAKHNPEFKKRRERKLAEAKAWEQEKRNILAEIFAGDKLRKKDAEIVQQAKARAATMADLLPEWLEVARKNMCGTLTSHAKIAHTRHASGRLVLEGANEVEFVLKHFPDNHVAKQLYVMLKAHAGALAGYDADAAKHGIACAEKQLVKIEEGWRLKYLPPKPTRVEVDIPENQSYLKGSLRSADDVRFVTNTILAAFQRQSSESGKFILTPCEWRFIKMDPTTKTLHIRHNIFKSFQVLLHEIIISTNTSTNAEHVRRMVDFIGALKDGLNMLRPLSPSLLKEPATPGITQTGDARQATEPQNNQLQDPEYPEV